MNLLRFVKELAKKVVHNFPIALTDGERIDRLTEKIIKQSCRIDTNCIDIGAHKGELLDMMLLAAPNGIHYAFEPLPDFFNKLVVNYKSKAKLFNCALSDKDGYTSFQYVKSNPAYSGIKRRAYVREEEIQEIQVELKRLDDCVSVTDKIGLIKIDVEGAELYVLKGAERILTSNKPLLILEHGKGGADHYGYGPDEMWTLLVDEFGYDMYTLDAFYNKKSALLKAELAHLFHSGKAFYFVASHSDSSIKG